MVLLWSNSRDLVPSHPWELLMLVLSRAVTSPCLRFVSVGGKGNKKNQSRHQAHSDVRFKRASLSDRPDRRLNVLLLWLEAQGRCFSFRTRVCMLCCAALRETAETGRHYSEGNGFIWLWTWMCHKRVKAGSSTGENMDYNERYIINGNWNKCR